MFGLRLPKTDFTIGISPKTQGGIRALTVVTAVADFHRAFPHIASIFRIYYNTFDKQSQYCIAFFSPQC